MSDSFVTPWTVACQPPHPWIFPGKNTGVGCHSQPRDWTQVFALGGRFFTIEPAGKLLLKFRCHISNPHIGLSNFQQCRRRRVTGSCVMELSQWGSASQSDGLGARGSWPLQSCSVWYSALATSLLSLFLCPEDWGILMLRWKNHQIQGFWITALLHGGQTPWGSSWSWNSLL